MVPANLLCKREEFCLIYLKGCDIWTSNFNNCLHGCLIDLLLIAQLQLVQAVARRAALHERIRDYGQAASDLQRLISILENQSDGKVRQSSKPARSTSWTKELRQARQRLSLMEEEAKKGIHLDLYCIL